MAFKPKDFKKLTKALAKKVISGRYEVGFAQTPEEVAASQALRYQVLFKEGKGRITQEMQALEKEVDQWDEAAFHVLVTDKKSAEIVGSIRLVSLEKLEPEKRSYTEGYFDLSALRAHYQKPLELSRACVSPAARQGIVLMLIWKFTMQFITENGFDVMFGCASFNSTKYKRHAPILSYLYENNLAPEALMPKPIVDNHIQVKDIQFDELAGDNQERFGKRLNVPTMLRGYLKLGAKVSDTAIIDPDFNTTFLCIYVDAEQMKLSGNVLTKT